MQIIEWVEFAGRVFADSGNGKEWCWDWDWGSPWHTSGLARIAAPVGLEGARLGVGRKFSARSAVFSSDRVLSENPGAYLLSVAPSTNFRDSGREPLGVENTTVVCFQLVDYDKNLYLHLLFAPGYLLPYCSCGVEIHLLMQATFLYKLYAHMCMLGFHTFLNGLSTYTILGGTICNFYGCNRTSWDRSSASVGRLGGDLSHIFCRLFSWFRRYHGDSSFLHTFHILPFAYF